MAWTTPRTWTSGEVLTAANFNTYISDNLSFLGTHTHTGAAGNGSATVAATTFSGTKPSFSDNPIMTLGVRVGADSTDNEIDDASQGSASTTLYIGNASITVSSDRRIKSEIKDVSGEEALKMFAKARAVSHLWDDPSDRNPHGKAARGRYVSLIAQDVIKWARWAVNAQGGQDCADCLAARACEKHRQPWQIEYQLLVPSLIAAVNHLANRVVELEKPSK